MIIDVYEQHRHDGRAQKVHWAWHFLSGTYNNVLEE